MKVVIIGAGVAGLSIGWRLAEAGAEITVLERAQAGRGATWASAGMISATAEMGHAQAPEARFATHSAFLWPDFAEDIEEKSGIRIGFRKDGALILALTEDEAASLAERAAQSPQLQYLSAEATRALEPLLAPGIAGALSDPEEAQVNNRALGRALATALRRAGGKLALNETVVRIEVEGGRAVGARTPFALYAADAFVLAAGAWSARIDGLPPEAVPPIEPVKGEMIALAPKSDLAPTRMLWGNGIYVVPRGSRVLVGATVARQGFDTAVTEDAARWLFDQAVALLPAMAQWEMVEHWAGLRPGSPDDLPLLGASALKGLFVASGQFRNGILFAPAIAEAMRAIVLEGARPEELSAFDPRRFG